MGTIQVDGTNFTVYGAAPATDADNYLKAAVGKGPTAWRALTDDDEKARLIVAAYRRLESMAWDSTTANDFATRNAIASILQGGPTLFAQAQYELAAAYAADNAAASAATTGSNIKRVNAKGVEVEYFRPTDTSGANATKLPTVVHELVAGYLASVNASTGTAYYNARGGYDECTTSSFDDCATRDRNGPF
jgi:hypothetical protein